VRGWVDAVRAQVDEDFAPHWGHIEVRYGNNPQPGEIIVPIRDNTDIGGAGGYHYYDGLDPHGVVFLDSGQPDVVLSHEILEIAADATTNFFAMNFGAIGPTEWRIVEVCDPVQRFTYAKRGYQVSDFVTRQYFGEYGEEPLDYSFLGAVSQPYEIANGGYQIVYTDDRGYEYVFAAGETLPVEDGGPGTGGMLDMPYNGKPAQRLMAATFDSIVDPGFLTHRRIQKIIEARV
jgi:hypothetical protein